MQRRCAGFTLIEVLIAVAISAILVALAVPSYQSYMLKQRRGDAIRFLQQAAGEQARFFSENGRYATTLAELGFGDQNTSPSDDGHYIVSVATPTAGHYVLTATPVADGLQAADTACAAFTINARGAKGVSGTDTVDVCW